MYFTLKCLCVLCCVQHKTQRSKRVINNLYPTRANGLIVLLNFFNRLDDVDISVCFKRSDGMKMRQNLWRGGRCGVHFLS